jgi:hypothetical protein
MNVYTQYMQGFCHVIILQTVSSILPSDFNCNRVTVTLRLAVHRQSIRLGDKPLETHDKAILFSKLTIVVIVLM